MKRVKETAGRYLKKDVNAMLACMASLVLVGVTPEVCECVLDEMVATLRKSVGLG